MNLRHSLLQYCPSLETLRKCFLKSIVLVLTPICLLEIWSFAITHGERAEIARATTTTLAQIMAPDTWLKRRILAEPTPLSFLASSMAYTCLVYVYYRLNGHHKHQQSILLAAIIGSLMVSLSLEIPVTVGVLGFCTTGVCLGLLVSDIYHYVVSCCATQETRIMDEEYLVATTNEKELLRSMEAG